MTLSNTVIVDLITYTFLHAHISFVFIIWLSEMQQLKFYKFQIYILWVLIFNTSWS